jgi:cold shock CspA family protein
MATERFMGRVKWFNNKAGYGFITVTDGSKSGTDVFVHHSAIKVDSEQYKYLVQGEYIEFSLSDTTTDTHQFQADEVSGIKGGKLMCETRRDSRSSRTQYQDSSESLPKEQVQVNMPRSVAAPRPSRPVAAPRSVAAPKGGEWTHVAKDPTTQNSSAGRGSTGRGAGRGSTGRGAGRGSSGRGAGRGSTGRGSAAI